MVEILIHCADRTMKKCPEQGKIQVMEQHFQVSYFRLTTKGGIKKKYIGAIITFPLDYFQEEKEIVVLGTKYYHIFLFHIQFIIQMENSY